MVEYLDKLVRPQLREGSVLTIGNFDGVHCGHRSILSALRRDATRLGLPAAVLTFEPHPATVFRSVDPSLFRLSPATERAELLRRAGADVVIDATFEPRFAALTPEGFVEDLLVARLRTSKVHVGYDFNFGRERRGNTKTLAELLAPHDVEVEAHAPIRFGGAPISSTRIRESLRGGNMAEARSLLGRPFRLSGRTQPGAGRGEAMGVPTLNLYPDGRLLPPQGVYASQVRVGSERFDAVSNLGHRPSFDDGEHISFETMILEPFCSNVRTLDIEVDLLAYLRPERRFESPEALQAQVKSDVVAARNVHRQESAQAASDEESSP